MKKIITVHKIMGDKFAESKILFPSSSRLMTV